MKNKKFTFFTQIIFYGAIWGFLEATIGYSLQYLPAIISGTIMFPIATVILIRAYNKTNSRVALLYIGLLAAMVKSIDFLLPAISVGKTFNPMMAIIIESFLVVAVVTYLTSDKITHNIGAALTASIGWRSVFVFYMFGFMAVSGVPVRYLSTWALGFNYLIVLGIVSGLMVVVLTYITNIIFSKLNFKWEIKPVYAATLLIMAVFATFML